MPFRRLRCCWPLQQFFELVSSGCCTRYAKFCCRRRVKSFPPQHPQVLDAAIEHEILCLYHYPDNQAVGLPVIERTIELNPTVKDHLSGDVLLWGDEVAAARLISRARCPVSVVICSDLLYGDGPAAEGSDENKCGAAEALVATLSTICSSPESLILSCQERRWSGDQGAFFFELMARRGFAAEAVDLGDISEQFRGDYSCGLSLLRIRRAGNERATSSR